MATDLTSILKELQNFNTSNSEPSNWDIPSPSDLLKQDQGFGGSLPDSMGGLQTSDNPFDFSEPTPRPPKTEADTWLENLNFTFENMKKDLGSGLNIAGTELEGILPEAVSKILKESGLAYKQAKEAEIAKLPQPTRSVSITEFINKIPDIKKERGVNGVLEEGLTLAKDASATILGSAALPLGAAAAGGALALRGLAFTPALIITGLIAGSVSALISAGSIKEEAMSKGADEESANKAAATYGPLIGAVDAVPILTVFGGIVKKLGKEAVVSEFSKTLGKEAAESTVNKALTLSGKIAKEGIKGGIVEGTTETIQEALQMNAVAKAMGIQEAFPYDTEEVKNRLIDAGALGAFGGVGLGGFSGALQSKMQSDMNKRALAVGEIEEKMLKANTDYQKDLSDLYGEFTSLTQPKKASQSASVLSDLMGESTKPLRSIAERDPEAGASLYNRLRTFGAELSTDIGNRVSSADTVTKPLLKNITLPFAGKVNTDLNNLVFNIVTRDPATMKKVFSKEIPQKIVDIATNITNLMGTIERHAFTMQPVRPIKLSKSDLIGFITEGKNPQTLVNFINDGIPENFDQIINKFTPSEQKIVRDKFKQEVLKNINITQGILNKLNPLRQEYLNRTKAAPQEVASILENIIKSKQFNDVKEKYLYRPNASGWYRDAIEAGVDIPYHNGYLPQIIKTATRKQRKLAVDVLSQDYTREQAEEIIDNITEHDGFYFPEQTELDLSGVRNSKGRVKKESFEYARRLKPEAVQKLKQAGLLEDNIRNLTTRYASMLSRRVQMQKLRDGINNDVANLKTKLADHERKRIESIFKALNHNYNKIQNKKIKDFQAGWLTYQNMLTLPLAALPSISEPLIVLSRVSPKAAIMGLFKASRDGLRAGLRTIFPKLNYSKSEEIFRQISEGVDSSMSQRIGELHGMSSTKKINDKFFKFTLLSQITQFSRAVANAAFESQIRNDIKRLNQGPKNTMEYVRAKERILELGILNYNSPEVVSWATGVIDELPTTINKGLAKGTSEIIMSPNALNRPLWMSDPHYATVAQLKGFLTVFGNTVGLRLFRELIVPMVKQGRIPADKAVGYAVMLTLLLGSSFFLSEARDAIRYGKEQSPRDKMSGAELLTDTVLGSQLAGFSGTIISAFESKKYGRDFVTAMLGPSYGTLSEFGSAVYSYVNSGNKQEMAKFLANLTPFLRTIPQARPAKEEIVKNLYDILP